MLNFNDSTQNYGSTNSSKILGNFNYDYYQPKYPQQYSDVDIEIDTMHQKFQDNLQKVNMNVTTLLDSNNKVNQTLAKQTEQIKRISAQSDEIDNNIELATHHTRNINSKLNRSVLPLYFCIIAEFVIIIVLLIAFSKSMYCLLMY